MKRVPDVGLIVFSISRWSGLVPHRNSSRDRTNGQFKSRYDKRSKLQTQVSAAPSTTRSEKQSRSGDEPDPSGRNWFSLDIDTLGRICMRRTAILALSTVTLALTACGAPGGGVQSAALQPLALTRASGALDPTYGTAGIVNPAGGQFSAGLAIQQNGAALVLTSQEGPFFRQD